MSGEPASAGPRPRRPARRPARERHGLQHPARRHGRLLRGGRPVIVGGGGSRGVVLSATYEARAFGVHSAMPMSRARRLCPQAAVIEPEHRRYADVSHGVMEIFRAITPFVEPLSLDEAFLDVAGAVRRLGSPSAIAALIRNRVADEQQITCSVGVAATKFVAKLASARAKPDGLLVVPREETIPFLHGLGVGALWGVGDRTEDVLARLGLRTVSDIAHTPVDTLKRALGDAAGAHLHETFPRDVDDPEVVLREVLRLSERVAARLRAQDAVGRTVVLKVRFADFTTITRSRTLPEHTDVGRTVYATARDLFLRLGLDRARLRLVGVRVEGLAPAASGHRQLALDERPQGWREAERAVDRASARFGAGVVRPAALVPDAGTGRAPACRGRSLWVASRLRQVTKPVCRGCTDRVSRRRGRTYPVSNAPRTQEVDVPLSENEQRLLEQMERALYAEDPKWATAMRGAVRRSSNARRLLIGIVGIVLGLVLLLVGVAQQMVLVGIIGFVVMLMAFAYTVSARRRPGPSGVVNRSGGVRPVSPSRRRSSFMQRLEERWERRRHER
jgi:DNA polymerase-4